MWGSGHCSTICSNDVDDASNDLVGVDVGADEEDESEYNFRSQSKSSAARSKKRMLIDESSDSEEEYTPCWDLNMQDDEANEDHEDFWYVF